jgi:type IV pilus assembly protein PilC
LFVVVIPQFAALFTSFGVAQSPAMDTVLAVTGFLLNPFVIAALALGSFAGFLAGTRALATLEGALAFDAFRMRLPLLGDALRKTTLARLCRVIATLLHSGVNLVRALEVAVPVAESPIFARAIEVSRERLAGGTCASLDEALAASGQFPPLVLGFIRVGGTAGNIPQMLVKVAEYYEEDVESILSALPTIIQTLVTLGLGVVVAAIVYIVYVPLSTLSTSIR